MKLMLALAILLCSLHVKAQDSIPRFYFAETIGSYAFLEYGLGDDRLGGAKMTYLGSGVVLKIIDSSLTDYRVQLSRQHTAYIAKESVKFLPLKKERLYHLSGSWKVAGDSLADFINISLDERLPYRSQQQINPSRILVDIFGATSNTNWITQLKTVKEIRNVYYEQTEDDVMRVIIELNHNQHWGHSISYDSLGKRLVIRVKRQPAVLELKNLRIAIDAGHGGDNSGAMGVNSKILEKDYTLKMARQLQLGLQKSGVKNLFMTRSIDTSLSMVERISMLKKWNPDILISIHLNSSSIDTISGTSTYYRYIGFRPLTVSILNQMLTLKLKEYGNIGSFNFALSGPTDYPNSLVEVAFLSNAEDEKKILSAVFHKAVAAKIQAGIVNWLASLKK